MEFDNQKHFEIWIMEQILSKYGEDKRNLYNQLDVLN